MTSKRKMVFGYRMEFGDIIPSPNEAETVQYIYATYLTGASFQHLAKELDSFKQCRSVESRNALFPLEPLRRLSFTGCAAAQSPTALREKSSRY